MRKIVLLTLMTLFISTLLFLRNSATAVAIETDDASSGMAVQAVPAAPTELTVTSVTSSSISIAWKDNSSDEDGFKIERCAGANCTDFAWLANMPTNVNNITDWGLGKNKTFKYRVQAYNAAGNSDYSNIATGTTTR